MTMKMTQAQNSHTFLWNFTQPYFIYTLYDVRYNLIVKYSLVISSISIILVRLLNRKVTMTCIPQDFDDGRDYEEYMNIQTLLTMQTTIKNSFVSLQMSLL